MFKNFLVFYCLCFEALPVSVWNGWDLPDHCVWSFQHDAGRAAYEDAQEQIREIHRRIDAKVSSITSIQSELQKNKLEALEARGVEKVCLWFVDFAFFICTYFDKLKCCGIWNLQNCLEEQEKLVLLEQAARQKVAELMSVMNSEKSQGSVLTAVLRAKESNAIPGIYGRMGDLGAIDGEYIFYFYIIVYFNVSFVVASEWILC